MPVVTASLFSRIEDLTEYWLEQFENEGDQLGINFVGGYDQRIITDYPAIVLGSGNSQKEVSGIHQMLIQHNLDMYIYHAQADQTHRRRSLEMLQMVTDVVNFLEADYTLGGKIIFGYVVSERPGLINPRATPGVFVISTLISYQATLKVAFE